MRGKGLLKHAVHVLAASRDSPPRSRSTQALLAEVESLGTRKSFSWPTLTMRSFATTLRQLGQPVGRRELASFVDWLLIFAPAAHDARRSSTTVNCGVMEPTSARERSVMSRRTSNDHAYGVRRLLAAIVLLGGCSGPILRPQSPEARIDMPPMPDVRYVSEYTHPFGMNYVKIEAVSLVTGLDGTGSDPAPTPQRAALLDEMKTRNVANPNDVLASSNTSMVLVRAFLRPGIQEGDRFDVEVRVPSQSETKSIRNGWLLSTRLTEMALLGDAIHEGHVLGMAAGPVLVDPTADAKKDPALATRGRVLGGGVALKSRSLGLVINHEHESVRVSQDIAHAIDRRFFTFVEGRKQGVATPKTGEFIDVVIHPRYKDNVARYMQVLRNVAINESPTALQARLDIPRTTVGRSADIGQRVDSSRSHRRRPGERNPQARPCRERSGSAVLRGRGPGVSR